ncbi:MAG: hypothetical protein ACT4OU_07660 [Hyphomicrobium sp.]
MSFGKRGAAPLDQPPSSPDAHHPKHANTVAPMWLIGFLVGSAAIVGLIALSNFGFRRLGKELDQAFEARVSQSISPQPPLALLKSTVADGWRLGRCALRRPPDVFDQFQQGRVYERNSKFDGWMGHAGADMSAPLADTADFIDCVSTSEATQLCSSPTREAFITDVLYFYREHKVVATMLAQSRQSERTDKRFADVMTTLREAHPDVLHQRDEAQDTIAEELAAAKKKVDQAIRNASASGHISKSDFGFFASSSMKRLADQPNPGKPCP